MRQDNALYQAVLGDLSDEELMSVLGSEIQRRKRVGVAVIVDGGKIHSACTYPAEWTEAIRGDILVGTLRLITAHVASGSETWGEHYNLDERACD